MYETAIALMQNITFRDHNSLTKVVKIFADIEHATLACAQKNFSVKESENQYYFLQEVPFEGEFKGLVFDVTRTGSEICISWGEDEVFAYIEVESDLEEELYHESCPPDYVPIYRIKSIDICGTDIDDLNIGENLKHELYRHAENYKEEMFDFDSK